MAVSFDAVVPAEIKRVTSSSYTQEEITTAAKVLQKWLQAGPSKDYATAIAAKLVVGDGNPYAAQKEGEDGRALATKAGARFRSTLNHVLATAEPTKTKAGRIVVITGKHPQVVNAFLWAAYWAPYEEPKPRAPKKAKAEAPAAVPTAPVAQAAAAS